MHLVLSGLKSGGWLGSVQLKPNGIVYSQSLDNFTSPQVSDAKQVGTNAMENIGSSKTVSFNSTANVPEAEYSTPT